MPSLIGLYKDRNRLQVWFSLVVFTLCAWWTLNPRNFHLLDGTSITLALLLGAVMDFRFPFNATASTPEAVFLLVTVCVPFLLHIHFSLAGNRYMRAMNVHWFAYAALNCFRLLDAKIYRGPAMFLYVLSLALTVIALIMSVQNSETGREDGFGSIIEDSAPEESLDV